MPTTLAELIPILQLLSGAGAGVAASFIFAWLRKVYPAPLVAPVGRLRRAWYSALYAKRYAPMATFVLATLIAGVAGVLLAVLTGGSGVRALDVAIAMVVTKLTHALTQSGRIPVAA